MLPKFKYISLLITLTAVIAVAAVLGYLFLKPRNTIEVRKGEINNVEVMVRLCTVEIYNEVPILDTIHDKVIFAIQKQRGQISFDMEHLQLDDTGDTVRIILPPEIVELYESTDDNSWEVIDTKSIGPLSMFRSDRMTLDDENAVKDRIKAKSIRYLYRNGTIERARKEGASDMELLMQQIYRKPVKVTDPTPKGTFPG
ncbi:MAG: hypothetical protein K2M03_00730 [Muribaculaceae bacterium]|nr:hypothetical protein [Muribaculaceae bacterium]